MNQPFGEAQPAIQDATCPAKHSSYLATLSTHAPCPTGHEMSGLPGVSPPAFGVTFGASCIIAASRALPHHAPRSHAFHAS